MRHNERINGMKNLLFLYAIVSFNLIFQTFPFSWNHNGPKSEKSIFFNTDLESVSNLIEKLRKF